MKEWKRRSASNCNSSLPNQNIWPSSLNRRLRWDISRFPEKQIYVIRRKIFNYLTLTWYYRNEPQCCSHCSNEPRFGIVDNNSNQCQFCESIKNTKLNHTSFKSTCVNVKLYGHRNALTFDTSKYENLFGSLRIKEIRRIKFNFRGHSVFSWHPKQKYKLAKRFFIPLHHLTITWRYMINLYLRNHFDQSITSPIMI